MKEMNKHFKMQVRWARSLSLLSLSVLSLLFIYCGSAKRLTTAPDYNNRKMLLRDEGLSQLSYEDLANRSNNWYVPVPAGRDIQLAGAGRVLIGTGTGYEEREISSGKKLSELTSFPGTIAARRLRNGNTLLVGLNWENKKGIVLIEVNGAGAHQRIINFPDFPYVRLVRETPAGNFLITADDVVFEGNDKGAVVWQAKIISKVKPHAWQALRLANGKTMVSSGYGKNFQVFGTDSRLTDTISGPAEVNPSFYAGFQILANGNYAVANWQGHGPKYGATGTQVLEYTPDGKLAWSWKQDALKYSSIQGIIVLDGLDINFLHVEDANGKLVPVKGM